MYKRTSYGFLMRGTARFLCSTRRRRVEHKLLLAIPRIIYGLIFLLIVNIQCSSSSVKESALPKKKYSLTEYKNLYWNQKIEYFQRLTTTNIKESDTSIIAYSLDKDSYEVQRVCLEVITALKLTAFRKQAYKLTKDRDAILQWKALLYIESLNPIKSDLNFIAPHINDTEWLVKEASIRMIRRYASEKEKKEFFYSLLFSLASESPQVLKQVYKTLEWYDDKRAVPYLYKRSFYANNNYEMIMIMRQLSHYKTRKVKRRLKYLKKNHNSFFVRQEAKDLLLKF